MHVPSFYINGNFTLCLCFHKEYKRLKSCSDKYLLTINHESKWPYIVIITRISAKWLLNVILCVACTILSHSCIQNVRTIPVCKCMCIFKYLNSRINWILTPALDYLTILNILEGKSLSHVDNNIQTVD